MKRIALVAAAIAAITWTNGATAQPPASAAASGVGIQASQFLPKFRIRFVNAIPGMSNLDMRLNYGPFFRNILYGTGTGFRPRPEGEYLLDVTTRDVQVSIVPLQAIQFFSGIDYTVIATGSASGNPELEANIYEMPAAKIPRNIVQLLVINSVPDGDPVDLLVDGIPVTSALPFRDFDVPTISPGFHTVEVQQGGVTVVSPRRIRMPGGRTYTMVVVGTQDDTDGFALQLRVIASR
jgi:hypothetical protein